MGNPKIGMLRSIFAFTALLAVAGVHAQQKITIVEANSVTNDIRSVSFTPPAPPGSTSVLNTDQSSRQRIESLVLVTNPSTSTVDLLAADNLGHHVLDYAGCPPVPPALPPCSPGTGSVVVAANVINYPNGLSADPLGNVFAVNDAPGKSPLAQVWGLLTDGAGNYPQTVQIDTTSPTGSLGAQQAVVETMIVQTPLGNLASPAAKNGDLLVVSQSPDEILLYPGNPLTGSGPRAFNKTPKILIPQCAKPHGFSNCIPAGSMAGGIAVWAADNSLLIPTFNGSILRFRFSTTDSSLSQGPTLSGLPSGLYKINAVLAGGTAVAYVAQSGSGNHGSILELTPSAAPPVNGFQLIQLVASVTSGVAAPQAIAATNTAQQPEANCLQVNGGCDLFGHTLNKHTIKPIVANPDPPGPNLVETLCLVAQDPRLLPGGSGCPGSTLAVNSVCPGFDNTTGASPMTIPANACGASGTSGTAFALIKSLTPPDQFDATYIETEQDLTALFPGGSNPVCGAGGTDMVLWAPRADESLIVEDGVNIVSGPVGNSTPTMVDITDGCGSGKSGGPAVSVFGAGLALSLPGGNTPANLQAFVQQKYANLLATITQLSAGVNPNVSAGVASQLTNPNGTGCFDLSLAAFNLAVNGISPAANFQDAADLLTNADATGTTSCDSIVTTAALNVPGAFHETLPPAQPVYNPTGQLRWRFGNIANAITMRILNEAPAGTWPPPVSVSVSPQGVFAQCTGAGCIPQQNPSTATLSWNVVSGASNCSWSTNDSANPPTPPGSVTVPFQASPAAGTTYTYTLTCNVPAGTVPSPATTMSASTYLTVWPAVTVTTTNIDTQDWYVNWTPPAGATGCTLSAYRLVAGQQQNTYGSFANGSQLGPVAGPATAPLPLPTTYVATYNGNSNDGTVYFTATCNYGGSFGTTSVFVPE